MSLNSITLGGKTVLFSELPAPMNFFELRVGAATYGWGRFLLSRADYDALIATDTGSGTGLHDLKFGDGSTTALLTIKVWLGRANPIQTDINSAAKDIVSVDVFDRRVIPVGSTAISGKSSINRQVAGFTTFTNGTIIYETGTTNAGTAWTWADLCSTFLSHYTIDISNASFPTYDPRNLERQSNNDQQLLDEICAKTVHVAAYTPSNDRFTIYPPGNASNANATLLANAVKVAGGTIGRNDKKLIPRTIFYSVDFPYVYPPFHGTGNATDRRRWTVADLTSTETRATGASQTVFVNDYVAYRGDLSNSQPYNQTELVAVAHDLCSRLRARDHLALSDVTYAGIVPFQLDGEIQAILWTSGKAGATTRIRKNHSDSFMGDRPDPYHRSGSFKGTGASVGDTDFAGYTRTVTPPQSIVVPVSVGTSRADPGWYNGKVKTITAFDQTAAPNDLLDQDCYIYDPYSTDGAWNSGNIPSIGLAAGFIVGYASDKKPCVWLIPTDGPTGFGNTTSVPYSNWRAGTGIATLPVFTGFTNTDNGDGTNTVVIKSVVASLDSHGRVFATTPEATLFSFTFKNSP